jgi:peptide deformylase|tara:strand:- start:399 stop:911 length:513 start_codon:yes stop_codon:yes gene_type:complete
MKNILFVPHPILRKKAQILKKITTEDIKISQTMIDIMLKAPGVGLAANQIGILKKIVTVRIENKENGKDIIYSMFNPKITSFSSEQTIMEEGCLSLPQQYAEVKRPENIIVDYVDENNKNIQKEVSGFEARVLQHEIDHLDGKLFVDYLSSLKRNKLIKRVIKLKKLGEI